MINKKLPNPFLSYLLLSTLFFLMFPLAGFANRRYSYEEDYRLLVRQMKDSMEDLRLELNNHETEIRRYEEKLLNQENIIDGLRRTINDASSVHQLQNKETSLQFESKLTSLEGTTKHLVSDLRQFKEHASETHQVLNQYKLKMEQLEKQNERLAQQVEHLQTALKSLTELLSPKTEASASDSSKTYKVKAGDSLEKIAKAHQTTVQALKELNQLANDKIRINQTLHLP